MHRLTSGRKWVTLITHQGLLDDALRELLPLIGDESKQFELTHLCVEFPLRFDLQPLERSERLLNRGGLHHARRANGGTPKVGNHQPVIFPLGPDAHLTANDCGKCDHCGNGREVGRALRALCDRYGIALYLDATRMVENAFFIQEREEGYADKSISEILKEFCSYTDGAWMSAKKDSLVNIGGWLAVNDKILFEELRNLVVVFEGLHTYGGLAGRDLEAMAIGITESVQDDHVRSRVEQVRYLGNLLIEWNIPIVQPVGGHAIFLDARRFYSHLAQDQFPAQTLTAELYLDSGLRSMERGIVSAGRNPKTGDHHYPKLELTRLAIPRRVYTQAHMDVVAESVEEVYSNREKIRGLKMVYEPEYLRFFQARFERL